MTVGKLSPFSTRFRALQYRNFRLFFAGQLTSLIGTWMQTTAQLWLVFRLTHSPTLLGVFGFASQIPVLLLASVGGYVADRYDRHRCVIGTQTVSLFLAFALAGLTLSGIVRVWEIIFIAFLVGMVNAFDVPIRQAFLSHLVAKKDLPNAIALNSSMFNGARVVGPAIAGFAIARVGEGWCFLLNGVSFLAVIFALLMMRVERLDRPASTGSALRGFTQGFHFVMSDRLVRSTLLLLSLLSMCGLQYSVLLPIFVSVILHGEAGKLGLLMSFAGVGAFIGALHFAARSHYKTLAEWISATSLTSALGLVLFSQSRILWLSALMLLVVGFAATSQMAATQTIVQSRVPDHLRGRVMAVYATMFMGVQPIGALMAGSLARWIGAPDALALLATLCLLGSLVFLFGTMVRLGQPEPPTKAQAGLGR